MNDYLQDTGTCLVTVDDWVTGFQPHMAEEKSRYIKLNQKQEHWVLRGKIFRKQLGQSLVSFVKGQREHTFPSAVWGSWKALATWTGPYQRPNEWKFPVHDITGHLET